MKKKSIAIIVTAALVASTVAGVVAFKCTVCNGTGWRGQMKCIHCGGDGDT